MPEEASTIRTMLSTVTTTASQSLLNPALPSFTPGCVPPLLAWIKAEGHELDRKWKVAKQMIGRRLSQAEAKRLFGKFLDDRYNDGNDHQAMVLLRRRG